MPGRFVYLLVFQALTASCTQPEVNIPPASSGQSKQGILEITFNGQHIIAYGNEERQILVAYSAVTFDGVHLDFEDTRLFPNILKDNEGNTWNVFGQCIRGPRTGEKLPALNTIKGYWFSIAAFYPVVTLHGKEIMDPIAQGPNSEGWTINKDQVFSGAPREAIPSIDEPDLIRLNSLDALNDENNNLLPEENLDLDDLVVVVPTVDDPIVIPHSILNWHEIVNLNDRGSVLSFCPLTGTTTLWEDDAINRGVTYGVSGLLYNSNLILYNRDNDNHWSQIKMEVIYGKDLGVKAKALPVFEMTYRSALESHERIQLLTRNTGVDRNYDINPYGNYPVNDLIGFPVNYNDDRLHPKTGVIAIWDDERTLALTYNDFRNL